MGIKHSPALKDYLLAFENCQEPLLFYYSFGEGKQSLRTALTRDALWVQAKKAASVIRNVGCKTGDCFALCYGANHHSDLAFRMASTMTGTTPVTINWQADTIARISYKIQLTECKLAVADSHFNPDYLDSIGNQVRDIKVFHVDNLDSQTELPDDEFSGDLDLESTRIIVFTSGTTGQPKGVQLPYRAYRTNRSTFEHFLEIKPTDRFAVVVVNPLHHTNSTAITDWALRRPNSHIHLMEKYTTDYWKILSEVASRNYDRLVAPTVSRHFDFLENLDRTGKLPIGSEELKTAMNKTDFLIGSAPVGPATIKRLQHYAGKTPIVRFGSTETCLQVIGTPRHLSEKATLEAFKHGWNHRVNSQAQPGYYIGRPHHPFTEARIVQSITPATNGYMKDCDNGRPGYLITRGSNLMSGYVKDAEATREAFHQGWYTGLKDIAFALKNEQDGAPDYYWVTRESTLLIRGGANYAYDQINSELTNFVSHYYQLPEDSFDIAVVGLKVDSEHEDSCCVTIEIKNQQAQEKVVEIEKTFTDMATQHISKGAKPDYIRFAQIPRNFKGAVLVKELAAEFSEWLTLHTSPMTSRR
ncbi:MAG TPA: class I adenylate-forming enzyme family protein [Desulfatiglandales bacterium]|nr:class I adenylate-forming enzyme family protein [Desulfatiglandales bacterium]